MKYLCACIALLAAAETASFSAWANIDWSIFKIKHNKSYSSNLEEMVRMSVFMDNKKMIEKHNALYEMGYVTYTLGMNHFGDMTHHEVVSTMHGFKRTSVADNTTHGASHFIEPVNVVVADSVDWRSKGAVTPVKDQNSCGSCWAFSATGSLEGQHFRKTGKLVSLSEQNLVDCSTTNHGCHGGGMDRAFEYVKDNHGIDTEQSYPYEAEEGKCRYQPSNAGATDTGFVDLPKGDEDKLKAAVATIGPISIGIDASNPSFTFYKSGVYYEPQCSSSDLDHAVLVVGYGTEKGQDYWLVKNSWSAEWGDNGYIRMIRNCNNNCGIATAALYPLV